MQSITIKSALHGNYQIPVDSILYVFHQHKYTEITYLKGGKVKTALSDESTKTIEGNFPAKFIRIHKNALVARGELTQYDKAASRVFVGRAGMWLDVSRREKFRVRDLVGVMI